MLRAVGSNAAARMLTLPLSAVLGIVVTRLLIGEYGQATYAQYALLVSIGALIPFADLGVTAALMNVTAASEDPRHDPRLRGTLVTGLRLLVASATVLLLLAVALLASGAWPAIMGEGLRAGSGPLAASLVLAVFAVSLVVSAGQRILGGLGLLHWNVLLTGLQTPMVLLTLWAIIRLDLPWGDYLAVVSYVATFLIGLLTLWLANRRVAPAIRRAWRDVPRLRSVRGEPVLDTAWPMLVQMVALPLAMQTDRIVLSHVRGVDDLAEYSLAAQMFNPVVGVVSAAGLALWPIYARARSTDADAPSPAALSVLFAGAGAAAGLTVVVAAPWLADVATGGVIGLGWGLLVAYGVLVVAQAAKYPLGMFLTDAAGLRFQALMIVLMLPTKVALSVLLAQRWGASGPVVGSVVTVVAFQVVANAWYVRRRRRRALEPEEEVLQG